MIPSLRLILLCVVTFLSPLATSQGGETPSSNAPSPALPASPPAQKNLKVGDAVLAFWGQSWWNARIIKAQNGKYCVKWDGYDDSWNECGLGLDRLKAK